MDEPFRENERVFNQMIAMRRKSNKDKLNKCEHDLSSTYNQMINKKMTIVQCTIEAKYKYNGKNYCGMHAGYVLLQEAKNNGSIAKLKVENESR